LITLIILLRLNESTQQDQMHIQDYKLSISSHSAEVMVLPSLAISNLNDERYEPLITLAESSCNC